MTDVEAGIKADWSLGDSLHLMTNAAAYYTWYDNIQRTVAVAVTFPNGLVQAQTQITNAAKATVKGFELNLELRYRNVLTVGAYYGYADAIHKRFETLVNNVPTVLTDRPFGSMKNSGGASITLAPVDDPRTGVISLTASAAYSGSYLNTTSINLTNPNLPFLDQSGKVPSRVIANGSAEWNNITGSPLSASLFVRNIFDKKYLTSTLALNDGSAGFTGGLFGEPRTYGLTLRYAFGP